MSDKRLLKIRNLNKLRDKCREIHNKIVGGKEYYRKRREMLDDEIKLELEDILSNVDLNTVTTFRMVRAEVEKRLNRDLEYKKNKIKEWIDEIIEKIHSKKTVECSGEVDECKEDTVCDIEKKQCVSITSDLCSLVLEKEIVNRPLTQEEIDEFLPPETPDISPQKEIVMKTELENILKNYDLTAITNDLIRKKLQLILGIDLHSKRYQINKWIVEFMEKNENTSEEEDTDNIKFTDKKMITGLYYIDNFLSDKEEKDLIDFINDQQWNTSLKRKTQHYGYEYNYNSTKLSRTTEIPEKFKEIIEKLNSIDILKNYGFDQVLVNEYEPGQGISAHIDHIKNFDDIIVSISLGSPCEMIFTEQKKKDNIFKQVLKRKSVVILSGDARYKFTHEIPARKSDSSGKRSKRISLTFRKVIQ